MKNYRLRIRPQHHLQRGIQEILEKTITMIVGSDKYQNYVKECKEEELKEFVKMTKRFKRGCENEKKEKKPPEDLMGWNLTYTGKLDPQ